jgi:uncharacterized protein YodC (DUF2158 family)
MSKRKKGQPVFPEGEIVSVNLEGAPAMIVHAVEGDLIVCDWFDGRSLCREPFHAKQLVSATSSRNSRDVAQAILSVLRDAAGDPTRSDGGPRPVGEVAAEDAQK